MHLYFLVYLDLLSILVFGFHCSREINEGRGSNKEIEREKKDGVEWEDRQTDTDGDR